MALKAEQLAVSIYVLRPEKCEACPFYASGKFCCVFDEAKSQVKKK